MKKDHADTKFSQVHVSLPVLLGGRGQHSPAPYSFGKVNGGSQTNPNQLGSYTAILLHPLTVGLVILGLAN